MGEREGGGNPDNLIDESYIRSLTVFFQATALVSYDEVSHSSNSPGYLLVRYINHLRLVALSSITETDQQGETQEAS